MDNIEIILVDDGSTDISGAICDAYAETNSRIKVLHLDNHGVSAARNAGIRVAKGKYLMFCDSDDYAEIQWCEHMYNLAELYPDAWIAMGYCAVDLFNEKVLGVFLYDANEILSVIRAGDYLKVYKSYIFWNIYNKIFKRDIVQGNGLYFNESSSFGEDGEFVIRYWDYCCYGIVSNIYGLYHYRRQRVDSLSSGYLGNKRFELAKRIRPLFEKHLTSGEIKEFNKIFFDTMGIGSFTAVLNKNNPNDMENQVRACRFITDSKEFQEWFALTPKSDDDMLSVYEAVREDNFAEIIRMREKPLVSVIVTVHDVKDWLSVSFS